LDLFVRGPGTTRLYDRTLQCGGRKADHGWGKKLRLSMEENPMTLQENPQTTVDRLVPNRTALIVVDVQRCFVHPQYPFGKWVAGSDPAAKDVCPVLLGEVWPKQRDERGSSDTD
jgi:hypothetical protein